MALPNPPFVSIQEAARELKVSEERIRFFLNEGHLAAYVPTPPAAIIYGNEKRLSRLAKALQVHIDGDKIYFGGLQLLAKDTLEVVEEQSWKGGGWDINEVQISFC